MDKKELDRSVAWAKKQSTEARIDLPKREPDEPPITEAQIKHIKKLVIDIDEKGLRELGMKQASALIDQIQDEKETFTDKLVTDYQAKSSGCLSVLLLAVVLSTLFLILGSALDIGQICNHETATTKLTKGDHEGHEEKQRL
jgi:uncharacterized membrane protein YjjP (DUF1212 family)